MNSTARFLFLFAFMNFASVMTLHSQNSESSSGNNSEFIDQFFPAVMDTGKKYSVWVSMKNNGSTVWPASAQSGEKGYKLSFVNNESVSLEDYFGVSSILLNQDVDAGQTPFIDFSITAPSKPGLYISQWRMMQGDEYFGEESKSIIIKVVDNINDRDNESTENQTAALQDNASFIKQTVPKLMKSNFKSAISITVENNGNTKWVPESFFLTAVDDEMQPLSQNPWGITNIKLPAIVEPGSMVTFKFQVKVPSQIGIYNLQFAMMKGNTVFGTGSPLIKVSVQN